MKHYHIRRMDNGGLFLKITHNTRAILILKHPANIPDYYIARRITFTSLNELVTHYKSSSDGLCVALREPCKKYEAPETADLSHTTKDQVGVDFVSWSLLGFNCDLGCYHVVFLFSFLQSAASFLMIAVGDFPRHYPPSPQARLRPVW